MMTSSQSNPPPPTSCQKYFDFWSPNGIPVDQISCYCCDTNYDSNIKTALHLFYKHHPSGGAGVS